MTLEILVLLLLVVAFIGVLILMSMLVIIVREFGPPVVRTQDQMRAVEHSAATTGHTHTLAVNSTHEEMGKQVVVKRCQCGHVVREVV